MRGVVSTEAKAVLERVEDGSAVIRVETTYRADEKSSSTNTAWLDEEAASQLFMTLMLSLKQFWYGDRDPLAELLAKHLK
ncbi:hypothetical protein [Nonomuraea recticatena]|uniref:Uncharacterized protein n=1 Tax=Nonomuraea recticatena TaxID=46178 RepID=A0ABP6FCD9_9ACTN